MCKHCVAINQLPDDAKAAIRSGAVAIRNLPPDTQAFVLGTMLGVSGVVAPAPAFAAVLDKSERSIGECPTSDEVGVTLVASMFLLGWRDVCERVEALKSAAANN